MYTAQHYASRKIKQHRYNLRKRTSRFPNIQKQVKRSHKQSERSKNFIQRLQKLSTEFKQFLLEEYINSDNEVTDYDHEIASFFNIDDNDCIEECRDLFLIELSGLLEKYKV